MRARETDRVKVEFTKNDVATVLTALEAWNWDRFEMGLDDDDKVNGIINKIKLAKPEWEF